jgi:hypothetical protein
MSSVFESVTYDKRPVYRIARKPEPWSWPDWQYAGKDGTFPHRWDDPQGQYRTLYACIQRLGAFIETLAHFRPDLHIVASFAEILDDPDEPTAPTFPSGTVPLDWIRTREMGSASMSGEFVQISAARTLAHLRLKMASRILHYGFDELDGSTIRRVAREFTKEVSRFVFECSLNGAPEYQGIYFLSRFGDQFENLVCFETSGGIEPLSELDSQLIQENEPELLEAFKLLGLQLERIT